MTAAPTATLNTRTKFEPIAPAAPHLPPPAPSRWRQFWEHFKHTVGAELAAAPDTPRRNTLIDKITQT